MAAEQSAAQMQTQAAPQFSVWALAGLLCSTMAFCPPMTVIGPLLGLRALLQIKAQPDQFRGSRHAWWAIGLGLFFTFCWVMIGFWWNFNVRQPLVRGPVEELRAGLAGDVNAFKTGFHNFEQVSDEEARDFLDAVRRRYGSVLFTMNQAEDTALAQMPTQGSATVPYQLRFDLGAVEAQAEFMITEHGGPPMVLQWGWLRLIDPTHGDLVYPASAASRIPPPATQPAP